MNAATNYLFLWFIYLGAAAVFYYVFWRLTRFKRWRTLSYLLRAICLAMIVTPWTVSGEDSAMAPALMVMTLDAITLGGDAFVRAMIPLMMAIVTAIIVAIVGSVISRRRERQAK